MLSGKNLFIDQRLKIEIFTSSPDKKMYPGLRQHFIQHN